jgi:extracellular elastinolytic metalloproteinase
MINNITVANAVANVAFSADNKAIAYGSSFVTPSNIASPEPKITQQQAIDAAEKAVGGTYNGHDIGLEYVSRTYE